MRIDAGAHHIQIQVGEHCRMQVRDDGCGMTANELPLAFTRHTTSKITCYADLLGTDPGFRGEALANIAAVARVTCVSRTADAPHAYELRIAGGEIHDIRPCAGAVGTQIIVERSFYTTPHRRNFWRQPYSEAQHIGDIVSRYRVVLPRHCLSL
jgi:DNA mismatch repair protein MutL